MLTFDALRFVAASGIVLQHANSFLYPVAMRTEMKEPSFGLALLVDLFFLISGFVIASVYGSKMSGLHGYFLFLQKRVARLWPLHLITLIVFSLFYFAALAMRLRIGSLPELSFSCLVKTALMLHAISPCDGASVNPVSWSISAEMVMYAIFPLLFAIVAKSKWTATVGMLAAAASLVVLSHGMSAHEWTQSTPVLRALPSFVIGICLCQLVSDFSAPTERSRLFLIAVLMVMAAIMFYLMLYGGSALAILTCVCLVCSLSALVDLKPSSNATMRILAGMGRLTYSIYMIHFMIVTVFVNVVADKLLKLSGWPMACVILATYVLIIILSFASYSWIEMPLRRALSPRSK